jgi:hypothetical protein
MSFYSCLVRSVGLCLREADGVCKQGPVPINIAGKKIIGWQIPLIRETNTPLRIPKNATGKSVD